MLSHKACSLCHKLISVSIAVLYSHCCHKWLRRSVIGWNSCSICIFINMSITPETTPKQSGNKFLICFSASFHMCERSYDDYVRLSSAHGHQFIVRHWGLQCIANVRRLFSISGSTLWNSLPYDVIDPACVPHSFRQLCKTIVQSVPCTTVV